MAIAEVGIGIVGGGLMGRELAAAIGRWDALQEHPVRPRLVAVCDVNPAALDWFRRVRDVRLFTTDAAELLAAPDVDVAYLAVPHHLHEQLYLDACAAGKDFLGEKPFGIDEPAAERIVSAIERSGVFVRCSSELPFYPGAQEAFRLVRDGLLGQPIEACAAFLHSSDLDRRKPIGWKRQARTCGELGVLGDLGLHVAHLPLRLGWQAQTVYAVLQDLVPERPDAQGNLVPCDTWDNATLSCHVAAAGGFPLTLEAKRIAPGHMNTWSLRALGMDGGVAYSTAEPKTLWRFSVRDGRQLWERGEVGSQSVFATVTGPIFESGFSDSILQMWASFLAERAGALDGRFGCATPQEALAAHRLFAAALRSQASGRAEPVGAV